MADAKLQCVISDNARGLLRSFIVREKNEAASPPDETASQIGVLTMMSRQPIFKPSNGTIKSLRLIVCVQGPIKYGRLKFLDCCKLATAHVGPA